jgi:hypothetical protein
MNVDPQGSMQDVVGVRKPISAASFLRLPRLFPGVSIRSGADEWGSSGSLFQDCFPDPTTLFQLSHRLHGSSRDDVLVTCLMNWICEGLHASSESRGSRGILQTDRYRWQMRCEALYHSKSRHYFPIPTRQLIGKGGNLVVGNCRAAAGPT